jgi:hypothetical protein
VHSSSSSSSTSSTSSSSLLSWWAPWDRQSYQGGEWTDPFSPSDGHTGFWSGIYNYGIVYGKAGERCSQAA